MTTLLFSLVAVFLLLFSLYVTVARVRRKLIDADRLVRASNAIDNPVKQYGMVVNDANQLRPDRQSVQNNSYNLTHYDRVKRVAASI